MLATLAALALAVAPPPHRCAADAVKRARPLLQLHFTGASNGRVENMDIDPKVKVLPPLKALRGKGQFDVLEVWGYVYKGQYRMRFIYARIPGSCVLMGQEIIEYADPY